MLEEIRQTITSFIGYALMVLPFLLTGLNIIFFVGYMTRKKERNYHRFLEVAGMLIGLGYLFIYASVLAIHLDAAWNKQLYNQQIHSFIAPDTYPTIWAIIIIALAGYLLLRFIPVNLQSPVVSMAGIAAVYLGAGLCVVFCLQVIEQFDFFLILVPLNCLLLFFKAVYMVVVKKIYLLQSETVVTKYQGLAKLLSRAANLPWLALLLLIPLLGIIIGVLFLFGQEPHSLIKAWTETADWTFSQKIAPPNLDDGHYLCTVAAGGHRKVVKPLRIGHRHGHRVIVNRQLCVANAFEQILEERLPRFHRAVRGFYDRAGYPLSRLIRSKHAADLVYVLMKPLEWFFLAVLYTVDLNPEDRIAVQYPHRQIPE